MSSLIYSGSINRPRIPSVESGYPCPWPCANFRTVTGCAHVQRLRGIGRNRVRKVLKELKNINEKAVVSIILTEKITKSNTA